MDMEKVFKQARDYCICNSCRRCIAYIELPERIEKCYISILCAVSPLGQSQWEEWWKRNGIDTVWKEWNLYKLGLKKVSKLERELLEGWEEKLKGDLQGS